MNTGYLIVYDNETMYEFTDNPQHTIRQLITQGYGYDDMNLYRSEELDFTVTFPGMEVKIKEDRKV